MRKNFAIPVLLSMWISSACAGDDGKLVETASNSGTTTGASTATDSASSTTQAEMTTSGASSTSEASGGTETDSDTGCTFLDCTTTGGGPECNIWADDCPEGQKCMPWANDGGSAWNATKCAPLASEPGKPGDPCKVEGNGVSGIDDCELGAMCWNVNPETNQGYCIGFCDGSPESYSCAEPGTVCSLFSNGVLNLCLPGCDPLLQECPNGDVCVWGGENFTCVLDASGEGGAYGDPCEYVNVCDPGLMCINAEYVPGCNAGGCCTPFCDVTDAACPGVGQQCLPWYEEGQAPPGLGDLGVCGVPQ